MGVKTGFKQVGLKKSCVLTRVSVKRALTVLIYTSGQKEAMQE